MKEHSCPTSKKKVKITMEVNPLTRMKHIAQKNNRLL